MSPSNVRLRSLCTFLGIALYIGFWTLFIYHDRPRNQDILDANITQFPYLVSIERDGKHHCGGAVISRTHVLTSAYCFRSGGEYKIRAGFTMAEIDGSLHDIVESIDHQNYKAHHVEYDIAIVTVFPPFVPSDRVAAVQLAGADDDTPSAGSALLCGWGHVKDPTEWWKGLQCAAVQLQPPQVCVSLEPSLPGRAVLCAAFRSVERAPYVVDSGSPLVVHGKLWGVMSWVLLVGQEGASGPLGVFVNAVQLRPWIVKNSAES